MCGYRKYPYLSHRKDFSYIVCIPSVLDFPKSPHKIQPLPSGTLARRHSCVVSYEYMYLVSCLWWSSVLLPFILLFFFFFKAPSRFSFSHSPRDCRAFDRSPVSKIVVFNMTKILYLSDLVHLLKHLIVLFKVMRVDWLLDVNIICLVCSTEWKMIQWKQLH